MKKNMGTIDKVVRLIVAVAIAVLYYTNTISGTLAIVLGILAIVFALTAPLVFVLCTPFLAFLLVSAKINSLPC